MSQNQPQTMLTLVVDNVALRLEVERVDDLIIPVILVSVQILRLTAVARAATMSLGILRVRLPGRHALVEEERVVGLGAVDEPSHGLNHVLPGRLCPRVRVVVRQHDDILRTVVVSLCPLSAAQAPLACSARYASHERTDQELLDIVRVVDTSAELGARPEIVDADLDIRLRS